MEKSMGEKNGLSKEEKSKNKKRFVMPDTYIIVAFIVMLMALLTWIVPPGTYDYQEVDINGKMRTIAIDGTFHYLARSEANPTGFLEYFKSLYAGCVDAADIIFVIFTCAGTFGILVKTGAFHAGIGSVLRKMGNKDIILVPILMSIFALGGSMFGMLSEFYGFIPLMVGLGVAMGYDAMFGFAIIVLGEYVGFMGATLNPYTVGVSQAIAGVPIYSSTGFRAFCLICFILACSVYVILYGKKIKNNPKLSVVYGERSVHEFKKKDLDQYQMNKKSILIMIDVVITLTFLMYGMMKLGWGYGELCGLFLIMSMVAAGIDGWSPNKYVDEFMTGVKTVVWGGLLTGVAKAIVIVMKDASIMDTIIYTLSNLLKGFPSMLSAQAMLVFQTILNFFIPSGSGQAAATMPIMAPLADMLGVSRQIACLTFQFGDGLSNLVWPTCGCVIVCGIGGISLQKWWKWFLPLAGILFAMQVVFIGVAMMLGL
ncbi:YfcC family protein [Inediibacterium massiliense]|uniref:YfcC family protein n=1 Tax=Inediibacterium massiliense TaxID=1658111 RepID=UPI0006B55E84|nr:AbgT family transporter [Inediibacterium massiliense]